MPWITVEGWTDYTLDTPPEPIDLQSEHIQSMRGLSQKVIEKYRDSYAWRIAQTEIVLHQHSFLVVESLQQVRSLIKGQQG